MAGVGLSLTRCVAGCWTSQVTGCHVVTLPGLGFMFGVFPPDISGCRAAGDIIVPQNIAVFGDAANAPSTKQHLRTASRLWQVRAYRGERTELRVGVGLGLPLSRCRGAVAPRKCAHKSARYHATDTTHTLVLERDEDKRGTQKERERKKRQNVTEIKPC